MLTYLVSPSNNLGMLIIIIKKDAVLNPIIPHSEILANY